MQPYEPLFPQGSTQAQLDQIDRRFAWFRRLLRGVDLRFDGVFPKHWRLQHRLCMRFLAQTRASLVEILEGGSKEAEDVTILLKASQHLYRVQLYHSRSIYFYCRRRFLVSRSPFSGVVLLTLCYRRPSTSA